MGNNTHSVFTDRCHRVFTELDARVGFWGLDPLVCGLSYGSTFRSQAQLVVRRRMLNSLVLFPPELLWTYGHR